jgi:hypothetical protein
MRIAAWALVAAVILGVWVTAKRGPVEGVIAAVIGAAVVAGALGLTQVMRVYLTTQSRYRVVNWLKKAIAFLLLD